MLYPAELQAHRVLTIHRRSGETRSRRRSRHRRPRARPVTTNGAHAHDAEQPDRWLKDEEAAALLGVSTRWLRRHGPNLPFRRSLSGKIIRYSEAGLRRWQARQRPLLCIVYDIVSRAMLLAAMLPRLRERRQVSRSDVAR